MMVMMWVYRLLDLGIRVLCTGRDYRRCASSTSALSQSTRGLRIKEKPAFVLPFVAIACSLMVAIGSFIIWKGGTYTEIDYRAYMQQVALYRAGERDYSRIEGDTGPLVYPAFFLYTFSAIDRICGSDRRTQQKVFLAIGTACYGAMIYLMVRYLRVPRLYCLLPLLSRRMWSLLVLRLFNDITGVTLAAISLCLFSAEKTALGCLFYSLAVGSKMNLLLMAPGLAWYLFVNPRWCWRRVFCYFSLMASVQLLIGAPFLAVSPYSYLTRSFNLGRVFLYEWTVNWKFIPERIFVSKTWAVFLLATTILFWAVLVYRVHREWLLKARPAKQLRGGARSLSATPTFFSGNNAVGSARTTSSGGQSQSTSKTSTAGSVTSSSSSKSSQQELSSADERTAEAPSVVEVTSQFLESDSHFVLMLDRFLGVANASSTSGDVDQEDDGAEPPKEAQHRPMAEVVSRFRRILESLGCSMRTQEKVWYVLTETLREYWTGEKKSKNQKNRDLLAISLRRKLAAEGEGGEGTPALAAGSAPSSLLAGSRSSSKASNLSSGSSSSQRAHNKQQQASGGGGTSTSSKNNKQNYINNNNNNKDQIIGGSNMSKATTAATGSPTPSLSYSEPGVPEETRVELIKVAHINETGCVDQPGVGNGALVGEPIRSGGRMRRASKSSLSSSSATSRSSSKTSLPSPCTSSPATRESIVQDFLAYNDSKFTSISPGASPSDSGASTTVMMTSTSLASSASSSRGSGQTQSQTSTVLRRRSNDDSSLPSCEGEQPPDDHVLAGGALQATAERTTMRTTKLQRKAALKVRRIRMIPGSDAAKAMLLCNFAGIVFARSLHYQFYLWYVFSLPFLVYNKEDWKRTTQAIEKSGNKTLLIWKFLHMVTNGFLDGPASFHREQNKEAPALARIEQPNKVVEPLPANANRTISSTPSSGGSRGRPSSGTTTTSGGESSSASPPVSGAPTFSAAAGGAGTPTTSTSGASTTLSLRKTSSSSKRSSSSSPKAFPADDKRTAGDSATRGGALILREDETLAGLGRQKDQVEDGEPFANVSYSCRDRSQWDDTAIADLLRQALSGLPTLWWFPIALYFFVEACYSWPKATHCYEEGKGNHPACENPATEWSSIVLQSLHLLLLLQKVLARDFGQYLLPCSMQSAIFRDASFLLGGEGIAEMAGNAKQRQRRGLLKRSSPCSSPVQQVQGNARDKKAEGPAIPRNGTKKKKV
ncbi:unnamed protein product [Amoebophrya sp. A25]|nr:unnamed protein product [Amoebophrya sp. A25]|eukprot:GSA25T00011869001.1